MIGVMRNRYGEMLERAFSCGSRRSPVPRIDAKHPEEHATAASKHTTPGRRSYGCLRISIGKRLKHRSINLTRRKQISSHDDVQTQNPSNSQTFLFVWHEHTHTQIPRYNNDGPKIQPILVQRKQNSLFCWKQSFPL